jgi:hypothetical protein
MAFVEGGHFAAALQSGSSDDQVVRANHVSGCFQFGPDTRMLVSGLLSIGEDRYRSQNRVKVPTPYVLMRSDRSFYAVPQLCNSNCSNLESVISAGI